MRSIFQITRRLFACAAILALTACAQGNAPGDAGSSDTARADTIPAAADSTRPHPGTATDREPWVPEAAQLQPGEAIRDSLPVILFLGNSLTAGYGLTPEEAFPALIQQKLDSAGYHYRVINAGVSGETSAGGVRRIDWLLRHPVAILVLELGANDALRGQDLRATRANLQTIIDRTRAHDPDTRIILAGMQAPPNLGERYTEEFRQLFIDLARENDTALIPFLLEGVGGIPTLNQSDGIHPTAAGQKFLADNVWQTLEPLILGNRK